MTTPQYDHEVLARMEAQLYEEDPTYLRRFRRTGVAQPSFIARHPRVGFVVFLVGLGETVGTMQHNILWPLGGVGAMYAGVVLTVLTARQHRRR